MHINHQFVLDFAAQHAPDGMILDYGCGAGETIVSGLSRHMNIYGVESFYEGGPGTMAAAKQTGIVGDRIRYLGPSGQIPFPSESFDGIVSNMVFEHVENLALVSDEIRRVLKPNGFLLALFPSKEVMFEGHCRVPFVHWLIHMPRLASYALRAAYRLGMGTYREGKTSKKWADDFVSWIQHFCFYRPMREIFRIFQAAGFTVRGEERTYVLYRLRQTHPQFLPLARVLPCSLPLRLLATGVFLCTPNQLSPDSNRLR